MTLVASRGCSRKTGYLCQSDAAQYTKIARKEVLTMKFPTWIDSDVRDLIEIFNDQLTKSDIDNALVSEKIATQNRVDILERVVCDETCKPIWVKAKDAVLKKPPEKISNPIEMFGQLWLAVSILESVPSQAGSTKRKRPSDVSKESDEIIKLCDQLKNKLAECSHENSHLHQSIANDMLASLFIETAPEQVFINTFSTTKELFINGLHPSSRAGSLLHNLKTAIQSDLYLSIKSLLTPKFALDSIIKSAERKQKNVTFWGSQIGISKESKAINERSYFIKGMTCAYKYLDGKPHTNSIRLISNAAGYKLINSDRVSNMDKIKSITRWLDCDAYESPSKNVCDYQFYILNKENILEHPYPHLFFIKN